MTAEIVIMPYEDRHHTAFRDLNLEWIERYFEVEAEDTRVLDNPRGEIIDPGGAIFMAEEAGRAIGTAAMIADGEMFELAKMAVDPSQRGRGIGVRLMEACLDFAQGRGATEVTLLTNDVLEPAVGLYRRFGFVALPQMHDRRYARGNLEMRLRLR